MSTTAISTAEGFFTHHGVWAPGIRLLRNLRFGAKAWIVGLTLALPLLAVVGWQLQQQWSEAMASRLGALRGHVGLAEGVLKWAHEQETSGRLPREQAQRQAMEALRAMRFDGDNYLFVTDMQARMLMHPVKPELQGKT